MEPIVHDHPTKHEYYEYLRRRDKRGRFARACEYLGIDPAKVADGDEYDVLRDARARGFYL